MRGILAAAGLVVYLWITFSEAPKIQSNNMATPQETAVRFTLLDIGRCVAILLLLTAHVAQTTGGVLGAFWGIRGFYYVSLGGLAVTIFLVQSGMALALRYRGESIDYPLFMVKRCLRIYPVYYLSLAGGLLLYALNSYSDTGSLLSYFSTLGFGDVLLSITGFYPFAGKWGGPFVKTSWFIGLIMSMYLLFPLLSHLIKKHPHISICALLLVSTLSRIILGRYGVLPMRPLDWFPLCRVFEFSLGIYLITVVRTKMPDALIATGREVPLISFISELSFPLFLIHYPLLFVIPYLERHGLSETTSILGYIVLSLILSWIVHAIDNRIPRAFLLQKAGAKVKRA